MVDSTASPPLPKRSAQRKAPEALIVIVLVAIALIAVMLAIRASMKDDREFQSSKRIVPETLLPARIPYADLIRGAVSEGDDGIVTVTYDFNPLAKVEGRVFTEDDLIPQLGDWNLKLPGSRVRTSIIRGEWRIRGEGRTRLSFSGPIRVACALTVLRGHAAIQLATNRVEEGFECRLAIDGTASILRLPDVRKDPLEDAPPPKPTVLASRALKPEEAIAGRTLAFACELTESGVSMSIDGVQVLTTPIEAPAEPPRGNVALRTSGKAYWDDVSIRGRLDPLWLEDRLYVALSLLSRDFYEPDGDWTTARELLAGARPHARTLFPEGDIDWVGIAAPKDARLIRVELVNPRFGISPQLAFFGPDGVTPVPEIHCEVEGATMFAVIATGDNPMLYARIHDPEGRRGTYDLGARVLATGSVTPPP